MANWSESGCEICRRSVLSGRWDSLALCVDSVPRHAKLWRCAACGAWWEEEEREAHVIDEVDARRSYPDYFASGA